MKPAPFDYVRPASIDEAVDVLAETGEDGKILAGGQSLVPMLNLRLLRPVKLIDVNGLTSERFVRLGRKSLKIGLLARHVDFERNAEIDERLPILGRVVKDVAHRAIRNRGTFAGSVCHNDPSAEWPLMAVLMDAEMQLKRRDGKRRVAAREFFVNLMTTALEPDELLTQVEIPIPPKSAGWGFTEFNRRLGDFGIASAGALIDLKRGRIKTARLALGGVGATAYRATEVEQVLKGEVPSPELWVAAAEQVRGLVDPVGDLQATAEFRRHLIGELSQRVLADAAGRADG